MLHRPMDSVHALQPRSSHTDRLHPPYTHSLTHSHIHIHILTQIHTISHATQTCLTHPHSPSHTPHTPSYTTHTLLTYSTHTHTHSSHPHTHKYINSSHTHTPSHTPHTLTHTHTPHTVTHTHSHTVLTCTHTHTHTNTSTKPTGAQTQETRGPRGSAHTPGTWSMWEQPRVPAGVSRWNLHTLGATGTLEAPRGQVRQPRGLRLTQLCPDQNSLLCRICHYDQWIPHRRWTSIHSRSASFSVKNTKTAAPQLQTPFPSSRPALPATDPGKRGSSYLDHPPRC